MKGLRTLMVMAALALMTPPAMASGGEKATKPMASAQMVKATINDEINNLNLADFKLTDESVDIYFTINSYGEVIVNEVSGDNALVTAYVDQMLKGKKLQVVRELQNVKHHIRVRYVVI